jgi:hypothetical protein
VGQVVLMPGKLLADRQTAGSPPSTLGVGLSVGSHSMLATGSVLHLPGALLDRAGEAIHGSAKAVEGPLSVPGAKAFAIREGTIVHQSVSGARWIGSIGTNGEPICFWCATDG